MTDRGARVLIGLDTIASPGRELGRAPALGTATPQVPGAPAAAAAPAATPAPATTPARAARLQTAEAVVRGLYEQNGPFMLTYVTGLLKDRHLAEDVVQETMLRAWRHCEGFSAEKGSVRGWLIRVAHNIAMDKLRMRRSRPIEVADTSGPEPQVGDHAEAVVTALHIRQALAKLSAGHREVLEQVYLNGLTAAETAELLGIPEGTVFSRAYYGLRMLRRELGVAPGGSPGQRRRGTPATRLAA
jgi:RNA polymerase sigma-70 factor (ECF subfamily)